jgi:hypothetical protein
VRAALSARAVGAVADGPLSARGQSDDPQVEPPARQVPQYESRDATAVHARETAPVDVGGHRHDPAVPGLVDTEAALAPSAAPVR